MRNMSQNIFISFLRTRLEQLALQKINQLIQTNITITYARIQIIQLFQIITGQCVLLYLLQTQAEAVHFRFQLFLADRDMLITIQFLKKC